jgi:vacuolar-type H+-ATPase subunit F/Vma7
MSLSIMNNLQAAGNWIKNHKLEVGLAVATTALTVAAVAATVLTAGTAAAAFGGIGVGAMIGSGAAVTGALTIGIGVINHSAEKKREKAETEAEAARAAAAKVLTDDAAAKVLTDAAHSRTVNRIFYGSVAVIVAGIATASTYLYMA